MGIIQSCPFCLPENEVRILWEITSKCNLKCKHCLYYSNNKTFEKDLMLDQMFSIVDNIKNDSTVKSIWISGGEPLLFKNLIEIVKKIKSVNIIPSLSTNATLINQEYAIELHNNGIDYVHVSIDGITADVHDKLRGVPGAFDKVMKSIDYLNNAGINVGATYIVNEDSIDNVKEMVNFAIKKNLKVISFYLVAPIGRGKEIDFSNENILMDKLINIINDLKEVDTSILKIEFFRSSCNSSEDYLKPGKGYNFLTISNSGVLGACPWFVKSINDVSSLSLLDHDFIEAKQIVQSSMKEYLSNRINKLVKCKT